METKKNGTRECIPHPAKSEVTVSHHGSPVSDYPPLQTPSSSLYQSWAEYVILLPKIVGLPYEYWGTLTYGKAEEIPAAHAEDIVARRFRYFVSEINKGIYGKRWIRSGRGVWGVMAIEKHLSGYPHHHFIMGGDRLRQTFRRLDLMDMWAKTFQFGWARIQDYHGETAARYLCKYVAKGGVIDVFCGPGWRDRLDRP